LTRRSLVTILVGLALLLIASTIRSGWLYLVSSLLFALVIASLLTGWLGVRKIELTRSSPAEVFEGEPFDVALRLTNRGWTVRRLLSVVDMQFKRSKGGGAVRAMRERRAEVREFMRTGKAPALVEERSEEQVKVIGVESLSAGQTVDVVYKLSAPKRGTYGPARMRLASGGVFGSAERKKSVVEGSSLTVFPKVWRIDEFTFDPHPDYSAIDTIEWSRKGIGHDYYGTREYVRGDSLRHVHWPSSARQGKLIVKEYEQELKPSVALVIALAAPAFGDEVDNSMEDGLRAVASLTSFHESMGGLPLLIMPGERGFDCVESPTLFDCFRRLADYKPPPGPVGAGVLADAVQVALESMLPGSALVLVTNAPPLEVAAGLGLFTGGTVGALVLVLDDSYSARWKDEWLAESPWMAAFAGTGLNLFAVTSGREVGRCLSEPLNITG
jgi:uncharacterized protein (DUF58 family)